MRAIVFCGFFYNTVIRCSSDAVTSHITSSPCHPVILASLHPVTPSSRHPVILSGSYGGFAAKYFSKMRRAIGAAIDEPSPECSTMTTTATFGLSAGA